MGFHQQATAWASNDSDLYIDTEQENDIHLFSQWVSCGMYL